MVSAGGRSFGRDPSTARSLVTRDQLVGMRTALINKIRGLAKAFGIVIGPGKGGTFVRQVRGRLPDDPILSSLFETLLTLLGTIQERSRELEKQLARRTSEQDLPVDDDDARRGADHGDQLRHDDRGSSSLPTFAGRWSLSRPDPTTLSVGRGRHQWPDLEVRGSLDPQTALRGCQRDLVAPLFAARLEGMGSGDLPEVRLLELSPASCRSSSTACGSRNVPSNRK